MLTGKVFEAAPEMTVLESCARHLADEIRNIWLRNKELGVEQWEETFNEKADAVQLLRQEDFKSLDGIDYIFKWWGNKDLDGLAGEITVIWKIEGEDGSIDHYKTWVRLAGLDFAMGMIGSEDKKREDFRGEFKAAFLEWKEAYPVK